MSGERAFEVRSGGKIYRAAGMETLVQWAREHRVTLEDHYRMAGTEPWLPMKGEPLLAGLLDPENWWTLKMGGRTFVAPDWETIVLWTREGRITEDVQITGPKTPPGGILGKASPELAPFLREPVPEEPERIPPRLRFDGRTFLPGDLDTVSKWIGESRVPPEAEISIEGGAWTPLPETGLFPADLWPAEAAAAGSAADEEPAAPSLPAAASVAEPSAEGPGPVETPAPPAGETGGEPYRVTTTFGEDFVFAEPKEILRLLSRKRIHGFDEVRHPDLPGGSVFVGEFIETMHLRRRSGAPLWILAVLAAAGAAVLFVTTDGTRLTIIAGAACAAVSARLIAAAFRRGR